MSLSLNTDDRLAVGITRRDLLKGSVVGFQMVCLPFDSVFTARPRTCFVGVGALGSTVKNRLIKLGFDRGDDGRQLALVGHACPSISADVTVLCGSLEDEAFWRARDLLSSSEFLISLVERRALSLTPRPNEQVVFLHGDIDDWLVPISCVLSGCHWIGVEFSDIKKSMAATCSEVLHLQAEWFSTTRFEAFLTENEALLTGCHNAYCNVHIVYPEEVTYETIETQLCPLKKLTGEKTDFCLETSQVMRTGSEFKMVLVASRRIW